MEPEAFEEQRRRLLGIAYRILGSWADAEDAVQEAWLRAARAGTDGVENVPAWLATVVARVCLNQLRARGARPEDPWGATVPDPVLGPADGGAPEREAVLADSVGLALQVVLGSLGPDERVAFVLHDLFAVPFGDVADLLSRSPAAARQLASRARRRVRDGAPPVDADPSLQRRAVDAFFAATRTGDLEGLLAVLHPDVVLRSDGGRARPAQTVQLRGARRVASQAVMFGGLAPHAVAYLVHGAAGARVVVDGRLVSVMAFTVSGGRIAAIDVLADPERLAALGPGPAPGPQGARPAGGRSGRPRD